MTPENITEFWVALQIAKFLTSQGLRATISSIRNYFSTGSGRQVPDPVQQRFLTADAAAFVGGLLTISQPISDYINEEIEQAESKYVACLRAASTPGQRNKCDRDAEKIICETLDRAKSRNSGALPTPLEPVWDRYGCAWMSSSHSIVLWHFQN